MKKLLLIPVLLLFAAVFTSALTLTPASSTITADQGESNTATFVITNDDGMDYSSVVLSFNTESFRDEDSNQIDVSLSDTTFTLADGATKTITITTTPDTEQYLGRYTGPITVTATKTDSTQLTKEYSLSVEVTSEYFSLDLDDSDLDEVNPGDTITVPVEVTNEWTEDLENVEVKIWIVNIDDGDDLDEKSSKIDIDRGDDDDFDVDFEIPLNVDEDNFDIKVYVTGEDADTGDDYEAFQVFTNALEIQKDEDEEVQFEGFDYPEYAVNCGDFFTVSIEAINTGTDDLNDMYLKLEIEGTDVVVRSDEFDLDSDKYNRRDETVEFFVTLPDNLDQTSYNLKVLAYNEDNKLVGGEYGTLSVNPCEGTTTTEEEEEQTETPTTESNEDNTVYIPTGFASGGFFSNDNLSTIFWIVGIIALIVIIIYFLTLLFKKK